MKKTLERLELIRQTIREVEAGLQGTPFRWGSSEYESKGFIAASNGYALVTLTKLRRGGHRLKANAKPVGSAYFNAPIKKYADLFVLGEQTERELKWFDLYAKGRALLEGDHQFRRTEYAYKEPPNHAHDVLARLNDHTGLGLSEEGIISLHRDKETFPMSIQILIEAIWVMYQQIGDDLKEGRADNE